jgi:ferredoxin
VSVCPVSCFHGDDDRLYIDPGACIDCGACVPLCPVSAIVEDMDLEDDRWLEVNAGKAPSLPVVRSKQTSLPGAEVRRDVIVGNV